MGAYCVGMVISIRTSFIVARTPGGDDRRVRSMQQGRAEGIFVAANSLGLLALDPNSGEFYPIQLPDYDGGIYIVTQLPDGNLWAGGDRYVATSSDGGLNWTQVGTKEGLGEEITGIVQDDSGRVWVGAYNQGVSNLEDNKWRPLP